MNRYKLATCLTIIMALATVGFVRAQTQLGPKDSAKLPAADLSSASSCARFGSATTGGCKSSSTRGWNRCVTRDNKLTS